MLPFSANFVALVQFAVATVECLSALEHFEAYVASCVKFSLRYRAAISR